MAPAVRVGLDANASVSRENYNYYRNYDPAVGGYTQSDPIGLSGGSFSTYGYVGGNPLGAIDPLGLQAAQPLPASPPSGAPPGGGARIYQFPRSPVSPSAGASEGLGLLGRCLGVIAIGLTPNPNAGGECSALYPPIESSCPQNDCSELLKEIYRYMNEIDKRLNDLLTDRCGMYTEAFSGPNANLGAGCNGSWLGHIHQLEGWQAGLRWAIERAAARGCPIPPRAYNLATRGLPSAPRGAAPRG